MPRQNVPIFSFAGGEISKGALGRIDVDKLRLCAETMLNWVPKKHGPMKLRAGMEYLGSSKGDAAAQFLRFVASTSDTALIEVTDGASRIWIADALLTRGSVSTSVTNGDFSSATGWTLTSTGGGVATISGGVLTLATPVFGSIATCSRSVTVAAGDQNDAHALRITITRGPVLFRVGTTAGGQDYIAEQTLATGTHSLEFTPTGDFYVWFGVRSTAQRIVDSITVEASGTVELPGPWAVGDLDAIRYDQSGDVVVVTCDGYQQRQFERRLDGRSWSLVNYESLKGPFQSTGAKRITLSFNKVSGNGRVTASSDYFTASHVGSLLRVWHNEQLTDSGGTKLSAADEYSLGGIIRGYSDQRKTKSQVTGTWSGTLSLQVSQDGENWVKDHQLTNLEGWVKYPPGQTGNDTGTWTENAAEPNNNVTLFTRVGFLPGDYTSGTAVYKSHIEGASGYAGVARITAYNSATSADYEVTRRLWSPNVTKDWEEGLWSTIYGYPSATLFYEGRLWFAGGARIFGSASDDYTNFDADLTNDNAPIVRVLGDGPVDNIHWMLALDRLVLGTDGAEIVVRSSNEDVPLTPQDMTAKKSSTIGSADIQAVGIDGNGIFVGRSLNRLYQLAPANTPSGYAPTDLTLSHDEILSAQVVDMAVQRQPDTRIILVLSDGTVALLTYEPEIELSAWHRYETDGTIEKVVVLPGVEEDRVYFHVKRTINGSTKRYLEKMALESETIPGKVVKLADCFETWTGDTGTTIEGFDHLEGESVVVWGDSGPVMDTGDPSTPALHTITGGVLTLPSVLADGMAGLPYTADWKSTKLVYAAGGGTPLNQRKRVDQYGLQLLSTHNRAIKVGGDTGTLQGMPRNILGKNVTTNQVFGDQRSNESAFEQPMSSFRGDWGIDPRIHIRAKAPLPATIVGLTESQTTHG